MFFLLEQPRSAVLHRNEAVPSLPDRGRRDRVRVLLRTRQGRLALYVLLGLVLFVVGLAAVSFKPKFELAVSDARAYYVYLPSLVIDGDLDFSNQVLEHWDGDCPPPWERTPLGLVKDKYPIGVALTLAPSFLTAHVLAHAGHALTGASWCVPDGYSVPYQVCNFAWSLALVVWSMALTDRLLTEGLGANAVLSGLAVLAVWLGSPLLYYTFREPFMAHAPGAVWVSASVFLVWRLRCELDQGRLSTWRLGLLAFTAALALVCRPSNAFLLPFLVYLLVCIARAGQAGRLLRLLPAVLAGLVPLYAQALVWYGLHGRFVLDSYEGEGFRWAHPAAWQTLFSSRHGLFFWSPLLLVSAAGAGWRLWRRPHPLLACCAASFLLLWYCNSAWHLWWFGDAFGGRAFVELSSLFVLGLAAALEEVSRWGRWPRRALMTGLALAASYQLILMALYISHHISRSDSLF
jgi:hypothetical protein